MVKLLGISGVLMLSAMMAEVGAAAQERTVLLKDRTASRSPSAMLASTPLSQHSHLAFPERSRREKSTIHQKQTEPLLQIPFERSGVLEAGDATFETGGFYDIYSFEGQVGQIVKISLTSEDFDTRLELVNADKEQIASNDDSNNSTNSELTWQLPETSTYHLLVASYDSDEQGAYQLKATVGSEQDAKKIQADQLYSEAFDLRRASRWSEALEKYEQALMLYREIRDRSSEGDALNGIGLIYDNLSQYPKALEYYEQALAIRREVGDRFGEGTTLNNISGIYDILGDYPQALEYYEQALAIRREVGDRSGEGTTLSNIGLVYDNLSDYPQALEYYEQALAIRREVADRSGEGVTLHNIGAVYLSLGDYPQALQYYEQALAIRREVGDRSGEGATLNSIGVVYDNLSDYSQALKYYEQALAIRRKVGDRFGESATLSNIGLVHDNLDNYSRALKYYEQALVIAHEIGNRSGEGVILNNIGTVHDNLSNYPQALEYYEQALTIRRQIGDRSGEGTTLSNIGVVYDTLGNYPQALEYYEHALAIRREVGDRFGEGITLNNIGRLLDKTNESELAIIFLKQSVNIFETIRDSNQALTQEQQQSYTDTVADTYRKLADLLLQENRVLEAQAVLDLLRTQELEDYFQDVRSSSSTINDVDYWQPEENILTLYQQFLTNKTQLTNLRAQDYNTLSSEDRQLLSALQTQETTLTADFNDFIDRPDVQADVAALRKADTGDIELETLIDLQNNIANLPNALVIYPLIFDDRLELILVPSDAPPIRRRVEVTAKELNEAILEYRTILRSPPDPENPAKPTAQKLYSWLIAEIELDLAAHDTQTIVYSPDGALRYIPLAALHDGSQWLAERFAITHITNQSESDVGDASTPNPRVLAGACADCSYTHPVGDDAYEFQDLPFTQLEVTNLAAQLTGTDILLNQDFSKAETVNRLGSYNIIHLATHGAFVSSSPDESFILFGDGKVATLEEMRSWPLRNADLVVLSACETGVGSQDLGSGIEVLGLGYQLERAGAKAAIASLWRVDDGGTQALMNAFYLALSNGIPKAEALRRAQLALIKDDLSVIAGDPRAAIHIADAETGEPISLTADPDHPYYWAPFILIGNGL